MTGDARYPQRNPFHPLMAGEIIGSASRKAQRIGLRIKTARCTCGILHNAAVTYFDRKDFKGAAAMARRAIKADPRHAGAHYMLGSSLLALKQWEEAKQSLLEAVRIQPQYPQALGNLAVAHYELGETAQALGLLIEALGQKLDYSDGWSNYLTILSRELVPRDHPRLPERVEPLFGAQRCRPHQGDRGHQGAPHPQQHDLSRAGHRRLLPAEGRRPRLLGVQAHPGLRRRRRDLQAHPHRHRYQRHPRAPRGHPHPRLPAQHGALHRRRRGVDLWRQLPPGRG